MKHKIVLFLLCCLVHSAVFCPLSYLPDSRPPAPVPRRPDMRRSAGPSMFLRKLPPKVVGDEDVGTPVAAAPAVSERVGSVAASDHSAASAQVPREPSTRTEAVTAVVNVQKEEPSRQVARVERDEAIGESSVVTQKPATSVHTVAAERSVGETTEEMHIAAVEEQAHALTNSDKVSRVAIVLRDDVGNVESVAQAVVQQGAVMAPRHDPDTFVASQLVAQGEDQQHLPAMLAQEELAEATPLVVLQDEVPDAPAQYRADEISAVSIVQAAVEESLSEPELRVAAQVVEEDTPVLQEAAVSAGDEGRGVKNMSLVTTAARKSRTDERQAREILQRDSDIPFPLHGIVFQNFDAPLPKTMAGYRSAERKHQKRHDRRARRRARRNRVA